jgi:hypothetical protein
MFSIFPRIGGKLSPQLEFSSRQRSCLSSSCEIGTTQRREKAFFIKELRERSQIYHQTLRKRAFDDWYGLQLKTLYTLGRLFPRGTNLDGDESFEELYIAIPEYKLSEEVDPDNRYRWDAQSHLRSYPVIGSILDALNAYLAGDLGDGHQSVDSLMQGLKKYVEKHKESVKEFSKWEYQEIDKIATQLSINPDFASVGKGLQHETQAGNSLIVSNLIHHCDSYRRKLEIKTTESYGTTLYSASDDPMNASQLPLAWMKDPPNQIDTSSEKASELKESIQSFLDIRAEKINLPEISTTVVFIGQPLADDFGIINWSYLGDHVADSLFVIDSTIISDVDNFKRTFRKFWDQ